MAPPSSGGKQLDIFIATRAYRTFFLGHGIDVKHSRKV